MAEPFLGEVRIFSFNFAPQGWALCNGQLLPIAQNQALFSLFGTTFGGDGRTNFALPDMRGRIPIHTGDGFTQGQKSGEFTHTLNIGELPAHWHPMNAANATPSSSSPTTLAGAQIWSGAQSLTATNPANVSNTGGTQAHNNTQPYLTLSFCVALQGMYPTQ